MATTSQDQEGSSKFINVSLALGVGILLGWKFRKWTGAGATTTAYPKWTEYMTPHYKLVLVVRDDLPGWARGKLAAHCSSAAILAHRTSVRQTPLSLLFWSLTGQPKVVVRTNTDYEFNRLREEASKRQVCTSLIKEKIPPDAKKDKFEVGDEKSMVLAVGPGPVSLLNQITGHLKLY